MYVRRIVACYAMKDQKPPGIYIITVLCLFFFFCGFQNMAQCPTSEKLARDFNNIEKNSSLTDSKRLKEGYLVKKLFEQCHLDNDSFYASVVHKMGLYEFNNSNYTAAIQNTLEAVRINTAGLKGGSKRSAIKSYFNLAFYYQELAIFSKALAYYDSTIMLGKNFPDTSYLILGARLNKANIYFQQGAYQEGAEESVAGISYALARKDSSYYLAFLNQKAQSLFFQNQLTKSLTDVKHIIELAKILKDPYQLASGYKIRGFIEAKNRQFKEAESSLKLTIQVRSQQTTDTGQIAGDYNDLGNFYLDNLHNYAEAKKYYLKALDFAKEGKDSLRLSRIYSNIGLAYFNENDFAQAGICYNKSLSYLKVNTENNILLNAPASRLNVISHKELILEIITNKTNLLLKHYIISGDKKFLNACLQTALLSDTLITQMRHEQIAEASKLYWRDRTREFFTNAIEACYLAGDVNRAFYFMEKSRSVLLNDELNELGAFAYLSAAEADKEQSLQLNIIKEQQELDKLNDATKEYSIQQTKLLDAKDRFEHFIKFIEKQHPTYYQYKYSDDVTSLHDLKKYLSANQQSFIHYFMNDTITYVLAISGNHSRFIKLSKDVFNSRLTERYLAFSSDRRLLNEHYPEYVALSNTIYKLLFEPLKIPKGRVIICPDNFLLPFESLCPDKTGNNFLLDNYVFSYVYSARYLLNKYPRYRAIGSFIGFAPVSFEKTMEMPELTKSAASLRQIAQYYNKPKLFIDTAASRQNFMTSVSGYIIVNVYSHASAQTDGKEPKLFMADSSVLLSQLQMLKKPAIQLVVLSACETNVGKNATGEGIYSLARGFAAAGVPATAATLWKTDEQAVYTVTEKFHENISNGMRLDDALQQAKLYLRSHSKDKHLLPYYWANMILMGKADPINLNPGINLLPWSLAFLIIVLAVLLLLYKKKLGKIVNPVPKQ